MIFDLFFGCVMINKKNGGIMKNIELNDLQIKTTIPKHKTKNKYFIDDKFWFAIETKIKQIPENLYMPIPYDLINQLLKIKQITPNNFGYSITEQFVNKKFRVHIGYEQLNEINKIELQKLTNDNITLLKQLIQIKQLNILPYTKTIIENYKTHDITNDKFICKISYINDNEIKNLNRKSYQKLQK